MSEGAQTDFLTKMMSSHPDSKERAENAKKRAEKEGLYKPYVHKNPVVATPKKAATSTKTTTKTTTKKK